jgi:4-carboxymuconolactone decarboxylase
MIDADRPELGSRSSACRLGFDTRASGPVRGTLTNVVTATLATMALLASASTEAQTLVITRGGSRPVRPAPAQNFTGSAQVEMLFEAVDPSHASGGSVTFEPGARTTWHSHPRGQILIVTAGTGRVQRWGDPIEEIRAGDVVRIPAGQKHWHGASPHASMTHIAITEHRDGSRVQWMEAVSDEQYNGVPSASGGRASASQPQGPAAPQPPSPNAQAAPNRPSGPLQQRLAPGLAALTDDVLYGDVWRRPELSPRDRSLVTVSVLIATGKPAQLAGHLGRAFDNGVQPSEASGLLAHLAIYCGWPSVVSTLEVYDQVYTARKIDTGALREVGPRLPPPASDAARARAVTEALSAVAPKFVQLTNDVVFDDLWRRSDLTLRDRSLVTIAALAAMGENAQLELYVRRGIESGLTRAQITEALTHLGFYAGWARATSAMTAVARTLGK